MWIPNPVLPELMVGYLVRTTRDLETEGGIFTAGHVFKVIDVPNNSFWSQIWEAKYSYVFKDEDGHVLTDSALKREDYEIIRNTSYF